MRGEIEIWQGDKIVFSDNNMLTDGAGSILADIMTISPSYSGIPELSSLLDTSNFTIQAMSFGTAPQGWVARGRENKQISRNGLTTLWTSSVETNDYSAIAFFADESAAPGQKSYPVSNFTPTAPDPQLSVLELSTTLPDDGSTTYSAAVSGSGQHQNYQPAYIKQQLMDKDPIGYPYYALTLLAATVGTYPPGISDAGTLGTMLLTFSSIENATKLQLSLNTGSYPNEASSIDTDGFISVVPGTDSMSGVTVSSNADFASNGIVEYALTLSKDDVAALNFYGGVYHMGLWALDLKESLTAGNSPPFAFSALDNPRKYKLFCRKGLSKDLTYIDDVTQYQDMTIKWRLRFL
mgnify:CR=1 FL=1|tara:strand:- start:11861 stop:12913 length:1053 start_codon:yes stop_codon:yes gene_type:complete